MAKLIHLSLYAILSLLTPSFAWANPLTESTTVDATVPEFTFAAADLISPPNNSTTNDATVTFIWERPSPLPDFSSLSHYDLYIDGVIFASSIPDSLTSQTLGTYIASASGNTFYVTPLNDLTQGYHTWHVTSFTEVGISASTSDWTFYLDSTSPTITVTEVDGTTYSSGTTTYTVSTDDPLLKGTVEANANMTISLICPSGAPSSCSTQTYTGNYTSSSWQHNFYNLVSGITYTVYIAATDAAGNTYTHPTFYLIYGASTPTTTPTASITTTPTATPTITPTPTSISTISGTVITPTLPPITATLTPPPDLLTIITPTVYIPRPPAAPTPPAPKVRPTAAHYEPAKILFYILLLIGLPTHLIMSFVGTQTGLNFLIRFLFVLAYPFFGKRNRQTFPLTSITLYKENDLKKPWKKIVSDIRGQFYLEDELPETLFVNVKSLNRVWKNALYKNKTLINSCLYPNAKILLSEKDKLSTTLYNYRNIPLLLALITSSVGIIVYPNYFVYGYLYLSLQYGFSEYMYPRLIK